MTKAKAKAKTKAKAKVMTDDEFRSEKSHLAVITSDT